MRAIALTLLVATPAAALVPTGAHTAALAPRLLRAPHQLSRASLEVGRSAVPLLRGGEDTAAGRAFRAVAGFLDRRYFLVGAASAVAMAAVAPTIGCTGGLFRPELTVGWGATCGIFFLSGLTLPTSELAAAAFRVREHAAIQGVNLAVLPAIMWSVTTLLGARISTTLRAGLLAMSGLPTTVNMCVALTRSAGGNEALAIFNAVIGNVLGVLVTPPLLLLLLGATADISIVDAMVKLTKKVIVPLVVGQLVRPTMTDALKGRKKLLSRSSETLLLAIVYTTFCDTFLRGFGMPASTVALLGTLLAAAHLACLGLTWQLARLLGLQARDRIAFIMCSSHKTLALGLPLFKVIFAGRSDLAVLCTPLLLQHPLQIVIGSIVAPRLKTIAEAEDTGAP